MRTRWKQLACVAALGAAACAPGSGPSPQPGTVVVVENHNWSDVNVYAVRDGLSVRLGTVTSMQTARFYVPADLVVGSSTLRLAADPIGALQGYTTGPIPVQPGQRIALTIENDLAISAYAIRDR